MSVLIKDMRMPENCLECEIRQYDDYEDDYVCPFSGIVCLSIGRQEDCQLVDLGKHADLIDRDALRAKFPEPKDMIDPQQALVHITGVWAEIDCADVVIEAEDSE